MLFSTSQEKITLISSTLSWVVLAGMVLACLLLLWDSLSTSTLRCWLAVASRGSMLLYSLLSCLIYLILTLHEQANSEFLLTMLPLTSAALIAGMYVLTAPHLSLKPQHRAVLIGLMVIVSVSEFCLFLGLFYKNVSG